MTRQVAVVVAGQVLFVTSLPMVAVDTAMGGELLLGFEVRGYQCLIGALLAPLALPWATPLWLSIGLGHVGAIAALLVLWWPPAMSAQRAARVMLTIGAVAACATLLLRDSVGITRLYAGAFVWCLALVLLAAGFWLRPSSRSSSSR